LVQAKYTPLQAKVNSTVRPVKLHVDETYRAGVGAAASAVKAAVANHIWVRAIDRAGSRPIKRR
jgi:hypothetical protein